MVSESLGGVMAPCPLLDSPMDLENTFEMPQDVLDWIVLYSYVYKNTNLTVASFTFKQALTS